VVLGGRIRQFLASTVRSRVVTCETEGGLPIPCAVTSRFPSLNVPLTFAVPWGKPGQWESHPES
jgi:hypothetical protein